MFYYELKPDLDEDLFDFNESDQRFINLSERYTKRMALKRQIFTHFTCMLKNDDCKTAIKDLFADIIENNMIRQMDAVSIY